MCQEPEVYVKRSERQQRQASTATIAIFMKIAAHDSESIDQPGHVQAEAHETVVLRQSSSLKRPLSSGARLILGV